MQLIERSLGDAETPVKLAVQGSDVLIHTGHTTISARLVEEGFLDGEMFFQTDPRLCVSKS